MFNWIVEERPDFVNYTQPQKVEHGRKIISIKSNNQNLTVLEQLLIASNNWILLTPTGWDFRDELKYSILFRALLVSGCEIYLGITENKNIRFMFAKKI